MGIRQQAPPEVVEVVEMGAALPAEIGKSVMREAVQTGFAQPLTQSVAYAQPVQKIVPTNAQLLTNSMMLPTQSPPVFQSNQPVHTIQGAGLTTSVTSQAPRTMYIAPQTVQYQP